MSREGGNEAESSPGKGRIKACGGETMGIKFDVSRILLCLKKS